jgi:hypothetical protein
LIVYVRQDGSIHGIVYGTSVNDLQGITALHDADYAMFLDDTQYANVQSNPAEYTITNIVPGSVNKYNVPTATGTPVHTPIPDSVKLAAAQQAKIAELLQKCNETLVGGFQSSALGSPHTYASDDIAQANFDATANRLQRRTDITSVNWNTDAGYLPHTRDQFFQVYDDGYEFKESTWSKFFILESQVKSATTVDQVNAITW